jgi:hypothetical protein
MEAARSAGFIVWVASGFSRIVRADAVLVLDDSGEEALGDIDRSMRVSMAGVSFSDTVPVWLAPYFNSLPRTY